MKIQVCEAISGRQKIIDISESAVIGSKFGGLFIKDSEAEYLFDKNGKIYCDQIDIFSKNNLKRKSAKGNK